MYLEAVWLKWFDAKMIQNEVILSMCEANSRLFNDKSAWSGFGPRQRPQRGEIQGVFDHYNRIVGHFGAFSANITFDQTASKNPI